MRLRRRGIAMRLWSKDTPKSSACRKSLFFKYRTTSQSPSPNPFPSGRGLLSGAAAPATLLGASPQTPFIFFKEVFLQSDGFGVKILQIRFNGFNKIITYRRFAICTLFYAISQNSSIKRIFYHYTFGI